MVRQRLVADRAAALGADHRDVARERKQVVSLLPATTGYAPERQQYARPLLVLSGVTVLVLLVACVNFTNLMLARSEGRWREFVIRLALGGGRGRLVRQAATECILLALTAGVLGLLFASWATTVVLKQFAILIMPIELAAGPDVRVLSFVAATIALVIAFGLWPCTRPALAAVVSSVRQSTSTRRARRRSVAGRVILVAQLSMCAVILIVAGLFLRTVSNLRSQELGFDRNVLLVPLNAAAAGYSDQAAAMLLRRVTDRLSAVPGIRAAGISGPALLDYTNYWVDGSQQLATDRNVVIPGARWTSASVGPGFFAAAGIPLIVGRTFDDRDLDPATGGVIINQSLARVLFGGSNPIGRRVALNPRGPMYPIVGVVSDAKQVSPRDRRLGVVYLPLRSYGQVVLAVRTAGSPASASAVVSHHLGVIAPDLPIANVRTMSQVLDDAIAQERLMSAHLPRPRPHRRHHRLRRAVRADGVRRRATDARARHPAGARREQPGDRDDGARGQPAVGRVRSRHRRAARDCREPAAVGAVLRRPEQRSLDDRRGHGAPDRDRAALGAQARPHRLAGRSARAPGH